MKENYLKAVRSEKEQILKTAPHLRDDNLLRKWVQKEQERQTEELYAILQKLTPDERSVVKSHDYSELDVKLLQSEINATYGDLSGFSVGFEIDNQ